MTAFMDEGRAAGVIYFNFNKAFDTIVGRFPFLCPVTTVFL